MGPRVLRATAVAALLAALAALAVHAWSRRPRTLTEEQAHALFPALAQGHPFRYDPLALLLPRADHAARVPWPEHEDGYLTIRTNNLGFREDGDTAWEKAGPRVLVLGDSHTQGGADNHESFANLLEERLSVELEQPVEVLNAAVAYTGPACYARVLERYAALEPDVVLAVVFSGNDFSDDVRVRRALAGEPQERGGPAYRDPLLEASTRWVGPIAQGLNQAYRFAHYPDEAELGLRYVRESCARLRRTCAGLDAELRIALLPTRADLAPVERDAAREARAFLGLDAEQARIGAALGAALLEALAADGYATIDLAAGLADPPGDWHWEADDHLSVAGHARVAELLAAPLRAALAD